MDFWCSLVVEIIGGIVTAIVLGLWATGFAASQQVRRHDEQVADLEEDNRRWLRDRDNRVAIETSRATSELAARGQLYSGAMHNASAFVRRQALHDYRDELTAKRRRYSELRTLEGRVHWLIRRRRSKSFLRFALSDDQRKLLASWRVYTAPGDPPGATQVVPDDPTSEELEPDLRRFEDEGDPAAS